MSCDFLEQEDADAIAAAASRALPPAHAAEFSHELVLLLRPASAVCPQIASAVCPQIASAARARRIVYEALQARASPAPRAHPPPPPAAAAPLVLSGHAASLTPY